MGGRVSSTVSEACTRFLSSVGDLVEGVQVAGATDLHAHRAGCASCAEEYNLAMRIQQDLTTLPEMEPPSHMWAALQSRLDEVDRQPAEKRQRAPVLVPRLVRSPARG
jgi:hypothetical protein